MKHFYIKHIHKLWVLCLCLSIIPGSLTYAANKYTVTKIANQALTTTAAATLSLVANGDTLVITGDSLDVDPNPVNDWWLLANTPYSPLPGKNFVLILETDNKKVPAWFLGGMGMTSIIFPNIEIIGMGAFQYCNDLTYAYLPNVQIIDTTAFHYCNNLTEVYLPNAEDIRKGAFQFDANLEITSLPKVKSVGEEAFSHTGLRNISMPNVETIANQAFEDCANLTSVNLPKAKTIGNNAFTRCPLLTDVSLPEAETIGSGAFDVCVSIITINLPKVINIGDYAFNNCSGLTSINYPDVQTIGKNAFEGTALTSVILPNVLFIDEFAFEKCVGITSISIPKVNTIQMGAFKKCTGLTSINMPNIQTLGVGALDSCINLEVAILHNLSTFEDWAFNNCPALKYMELGNPPAFTSDGFGGTTGAVLIVVPDTNAYGPALSYPLYSPGSEVHLRRVSTESRMFRADSLETLGAMRGDIDPALAAGGTFVWKKDGYPIPGANTSSYTPTEPGWYTLEFTHGGTVVLQSVYLAAETVEVYDSRARYADCSYTLVLTFTPSGADRTVTVSTKGSGAAYLKDVASGNLFKDKVTYKLPKNTTILEIPYEVIPGMGSNNQVQFEWEVSDFPIVYDTDVFTLYDAYVITYRYYRPTVNYKGLLEIYIIGGSLYMERSLDGGVTWEPARDLVTGKALPFTQSQIYNLESYLLFRQPNTCVPNDTLRLYDGHEPNDILREVFIPSVTDAVCSVEPGEHYVESQGDFTFTVTGIQPGYVLNVSTSRVIYPDSEGGLLVERNADGSYTVTIFNIQEPTIVSMDFSVGNMLIENAYIWASDGVLHLQSVESCDALIYTVTGALVQHVRLSAGENFNLPLAKGYYFVAVGGKTYKVIL